MGSRLFKVPLFGTLLLCPANQDGDNSTFDFLGVLVRKLLRLGRKVSHFHSILPALNLGILCHDSSFLLS